MSACIETSVGIQWLLHPARYLSQAHWYFSGSSWFTSARALIIALSATSIREAPTAIVPSPVTLLVVVTGRPRSQGLRSGREQVHRATNRPSVPREPASVPPVLRQPRPEKRQGPELPV